MNIEDLAGKNVCIIGFGREGKSALDAIHRFNIDCSVTIADRNTELGVTGVALKLGDDHLQNLDIFDVVIVSPGVPPNPLIDDLGSKVSNTTQLFFDWVKPNHTVIGVTGSKGKSTTTSLIAHMLQTDRPNVHIAGNIGIPVLDLYTKELLAEPQIFVCELSSAQLSRMHVSPHIGVLVSMFPEHLDYHGSVDAYYEAKGVLTKYQSTGDVIFYNQDNAVCVQYAQQSAGSKYSYSNDDRGFTCALLGKHNHYNINAAVDVAKHMSVNDEVIVKALESFSPLPHRLQNLDEHHGIHWINDSISTAPETCIAALEALGGVVETLIIGGVDRGIDYSLLAEYLAASNIKHLITIPDAGNTVTSLLSESVSFEIHAVESLEQAVKVAKTVTTPDATCLLSPAAASYNHFKNFEVRGEEFEKLIKN